MVRFFKNLFLAGMFLCFAISFAYGYFQNFYVEMECHSYGEEFDTRHYNREEIPYNKYGICTVADNEEEDCECLIEGGDK